MQARPTPGVDRIYRIAYLVTHPIQYQAPLLRLIAAQPDIDLAVFFQSDMSLGAYEDEGFGHGVKWDVPLVEGYQHEFLPGLWRRGPISSQRPVSWGLSSRLRRSRFDVLWVHGYARWVNWAAIVCAKTRGLKVLVRDEATGFSASRSFALRGAKHVFFKLLSAGVDAFLAVGSANRDYYLAHSIAEDRIFRMPYCVDNDFFADRARSAAATREQLRLGLQLEAGRPVILYASKFEPRKRPRDLLNAYERLAHRTGVEARPYLLFVGDGALRAQVQAEAGAKGLEDVRFLGFRNQTELPALYDLCDVFVLPSTEEPWGLVVNEVMAVGKPVIVSDAVGCARDLVCNDINGLVFPVGKIEALAEALAKIVFRPDRAVQMGRESRKMIGRWSFNEDLAGLRGALRAVIG